MGEVECNRVVVVSWVVVGVLEIAVSYAISGVGGAIAEVRVLGIAVGVVVKAVPPYAVWSLLRYLCAGVGDIAATEVVGGVDITITGVCIAIAGVGMTIAKVGVRIIITGVCIAIAGVDMVVDVVGIIVKVVPPDVAESLSRTTWTGVGGRAAK